MFLEFFILQWQRFKSAYAHFNSSDGWVMSSHVALSVMISIFPFLIFAASFAGFMGSNVSSDSLVELIFENWPKEISEPLTREIDIVLTQGNAGFLTIGIGLALIFASNGIEAIRIALMRAYKDTEVRSFWFRRLQSLFFVIVGALLLSAISVLLLFAPLYLSFIENRSPSFYESFFRNETLTQVTASVLLVFIVFACHYWLPVRRRSISQIWPGILVTLVLWIVTAEMFSQYVRLFANYSATYAGLAGFMSVIFFLYLMAVLLIFGAEFNSARASIPRRDAAKG